MKLTLKPFGSVEPRVLQHLGASLRDFEVTRVPEAPLPEEGFDAARGQYRASSLFAACLEEPGTRVLGVTEADLYEVSLNFVFGFSQPSGRVAVISLHRLHDVKEELFLERCAKEAVHEIGHTLGLSHDETNRRCVMRFSRNLEDTDRKGAEYCEECGARARVTLNRLRT